MKSTNILMIQKMFEEFDLGDEESRQRFQQWSEPSQTEHGMKSIFIDDNCNTEIGDDSDAELA